MSINYSNNASLHDHRLKVQRLVADATITADATPADKGHASDAPGAVVLRTEGKTSDADTIEDVSGQLAGAAAADSTGIFQVLVDDDASKIYSVTVTPSVGTATSTSKVTSGGRLLVEVDSDQDLSSTSVTVTLEMEYKN